MAHSYVQAHKHEADAFEAFVLRFNNTTLLVDTYDTLTGVHQVIELARRLGAKFTVRAVRLDSGDLADLAIQTRRLLDQAGLERVTIFASSGLDEHSVRDLIRRGAPIDAFGVGTKLAVSSDAPALDMAFKLVEYAGRARTKLSADKVLLPGRKQVFRTVQDGCLMQDVLGCWDESLEGEPLLCSVMQGGRRTATGQATLADARDHARRQLAQLPPQLKASIVLKRAKLVVSDALQRKMDSVRQNYRPSQQLAWQNRRVESLSLRRVLDERFLQQFIFTGLVLADALNPPQHFFTEDIIQILGSFRYLNERNQRLHELPVLLNQTPNRMF
jgi:nicotinate phosphoribosyltransferase